MKTNRSEFCNTVKNGQNDRILVLIGGLFVNNFALIHYCWLKFLHKVDIIM